MFDRHFNGNADTPVLALYRFVTRAVILRAAERARLSGVFEKVDVVHVVRLLDTAAHVLPVKKIAPADREASRFRAGIEQLGHPSEDRVLLSWSKRLLLLLSNGRL